MILAKEFQPPPFMSKMHGTGWEISPRVEEL
jgi:hypothetical protein